jgi:hypothetical protein
VGVLVWYDNQRGYHDAGNFADLLAAVFSGIAAIWLIVAVFVQSEELRLQRLELALQRDQTRLLTEEAKVQAQSQTASLALQTKRDLYAQVDSIVNSNAEVFREVARRLRAKAVNQIDQTYTEHILQGAGGSVTFSRKCAAVVLFQQGGGETQHEVSWEILLDQPLADHDAWGAILSCAAEAIVADVGVWWRDNLAMSVPAHGRIAPNDVAATLLAALYRVDESLQVLEV